MNRAARTIILAAVIVLVAGAGAYLCAMRLCARQMAADDLSWLKREFRLSQGEMSRIRQLHNGYLPKCREMCAKIAAKQGEVEKALATGEVVDQKLIELGMLRAQCQAQMLRHFQDVSREMSTEQGKRYLSEMERLTLGFHGEVERSMGETPPSGHGHGKG